MRRASTQKYVGLQRISDRAGTEYMQTQMWKHLARTRARKTAEKTYLRDASQQRSKVAWGDLALERAIDADPRRISESFPIAPEERS